jgi:hypothetical protein
MRDVRPISIARAAPATILLHERHDVSHGTERDKIEF